MSAVSKTQTNVVIIHAVRIMQLFLQFSILWEMQNDVRALPLAVSFLETKKICQSHMSTSF